MSFVKLDCEIIDRSIWSEGYATRIVWITMLAMCNAEGHVMASVDGLARRAAVTVEEAEEAISKFLGPDPNSSDGTTGERIEKIDRGWLVLNYRKRRDQQTNAQIAAARRQREYRRRHGVTGNDVTRRDSYSHTEGEGEGELKQNPGKNPDSVADSVEPASPKPDLVAEIWAYFNARRAEVIAKSRALPLTADRRKAVRARLRDGYTPEDCRLVVDSYARQVARDPEQAQWFNGSTPWRPDNFARALDRPEPTASRTTGHAKIDGSETYAGGEVKI